MALNFILKSEKTGAPRTRRIGFARRPKADRHPTRVPPLLLTTSSLIQKPALLLIGFLTGVGLNATASELLPFKDSGVLHEALQTIEENFITTTNRNQLIYGALSGAIRTLDPHSVFYTPKQYATLSDATTEKAAEVGIDIDFGVTPPQVVALRAGSPADEAGIHLHDKILQMDSQAIDSIPPSQIPLLLKGEEGTQLQLTIKRKKESSLRVFTLERKRHFKPSFEVNVSEDHIAFIKLTAFTPGVARQLRSHLIALPSLSGILLDLRDNSGGLFDEAVEVCDLFLTEGMLVRAVGRDGEVLTEQQASEMTFSQTLPLALLVNRNSASASEIVTAAMQDHQRAHVFGEQTYGKGSIQSLFPLSDGSGLKLTIARYQSPKGTGIDQFGIQPNTLCPPEKALEEATRWLTKLIER